MALYGLGGLFKFFDAWGDRNKDWVVICQGMISTHANTMSVENRLEVLKAKIQHFM